MENFGEFVVNHWVLWTLFFGLLALIVGSTISAGLSGGITVNTTEAIQIVNHKKGFFIDIGCHHPFKANNTFLLYKSGWSGMNIDLNKISIDLFILTLNIIIIY